MSYPIEAHWLAAKCFLRYLQGTVYLCLTFTALSNIDLVHFYHDDHASYPDNGRNISAYCIFLGDCFVS